MRADLFVPFAEKDEAKKLGAQWDPNHKVWYKPEEVSFKPFTKWLKGKRLPRTHKKGPPPPYIEFTDDKERNLVARIDDLEVGFSIDDDSCYIVVWGSETGVPCDYTDSECPDDKNRHWKNCPLADNCPYEFTSITSEQSTGMTGEGDRAALELKIKDMFKNKHDGIAHKCKWPEPAASEFATAPWRFNDKNHGSK